MVDPIPEEEISSIDQLILDMKATKAAEPSLEIADVLRIYHIDATNRLTNIIKQLGYKNG